MRTLALEAFYDRLVRAILEDPLPGGDEDLGTHRTRMRSRRAYRSCLAELKRLELVWVEDGHLMCSVVRLEKERRAGARERFAGSSVGSRSELGGCSVGSRP